MPLQHSPPARQTRSQARAQAVLTPTPRAALDGTPAVPPLKEQSRREQHHPGRNKEGPAEDGEEDEENSVEEKESYGTEAAPAPVGASEGMRGLTLSQSDKTVSHKTEPSLLDIMQQMTKIMANLQAGA
ncbi:hypothetical protein O181_072563 [Austropuccinia psidii MF-1]|uniref:Uncharacterized protein n=1 Tax=Austropuccinia psidii MF-1 TaxID=1389203 RepID=A0A9Q3F386_9BASI|nr:hypothetical protein [Austropuccinia psidii MF-1]